MRSRLVVFEAILWLIQLLLLAVVGFCVIIWHKSEFAMILPEMIIPWLLGAYVLMLTVCKLWFKESVSWLVLVNVLVPWATYHWGTFPFEEYAGRVWMQLLFYGIAQTVWIWATNPVWTGKLIEWIRYHGK